MTATSADATAEPAASAFDAARSGGVIDTFLAMPDTREKQAAKYDNIRRLANDEGTQAMEMPAEYMFKGVPTFADDEVGDPVRVVLREMAKHRNAGYYAAGLTLDRIFSELPDVGFRDHVWPQFLRENAARVFDIAPVAPPDPPT